MFAHAREHERRERVIDEWLVVEQQQSCLEIAHVTGYSRVPEPPARTMPLVINSSLRRSPRSCV